MPFGYAMTVHGERPFGAVLKGLAGYVAGSIGYIAIPLLLVQIAAWPSWATVADMIWPRDIERRLVAAAFWGPFLLPVVGALASATEITSLWSMPAWTLLPVVLLSPAAVRLNAATRAAFLSARSRYR